MYMFSRQTVINSKAGAEWAATACATVQDITDRECQLWARVYSPDYGTIAWTSWFEDLTSLEAAGDKLQGDERYLSTIGQSSSFTTGASSDLVLQAITGEPPTEPMAYVTSLQAVTARGSIARASEVGAEFAHQMQTLTGRPTVFTATLTGRFGSVGWLTWHDSIASVQESSETLRANARWLALVDANADVFADDPSAMQQHLYRRLM